MLTSTDRTQGYTITPAGRDILGLPREDWDELWDDHRHGSRLFTLMALKGGAQTVWSIVCYYTVPQLYEEEVRTALHELVVAGLVEREPGMRARKHRGVDLQ
jgi:hypothetical protein